MSYLKKVIILILILLLEINLLSSNFILKANNNLSETEETLKFASDNEINLSDIDITENEVLFDDKNQLIVGNIVEFGNFYDTVEDSDELIKTPIRWKVLDNINENFLLITEYILKTMPYNFSWSPTNWKDSNIRLWLNNDFYDIAFNENEKKIIQKVATENTGNFAYNIKNQFKTYDRVFLLSIEEAKQYFKYSKDYMAVGTNYAKREGLWISKYSSSVGFSVWWLRSPGRTWSSAAIIHAAGGIGLGGDGVATRGNGVRPCIWINANYGG